jgi:hypothetical protein
MARRKRKNNDLQNNTQKTRDWTTTTPQKTGDEMRCSGKVTSSCFTKMLSEVLKLLLLRSNSNRTYFSSQVSLLAFFVIIYLY